MNGNDVGERTRKSAAQLRSHGKRLVVLGLGCALLLAIAPPDACCPVSGSPDSIAVLDCCQGMTCISMQVDVSMVAPPSSSMASTGELGLYGETAGTPRLTVVRSSLTEVRCEEWGGASALSIPLRI